MKNTKTQISDLRSGTKSQILNENINYSILPQATSHVGHAGTKNAICQKIWEKVLLENPEKMTIKFLGEKIVLNRKDSISGKTSVYNGYISNEIAKNKCGFMLTRKVKDGKDFATISVQFADVIVVGNGGKANKYVCPSLIEIIENN
ncbi:hypothetical protein N9H19_00785 [Flavobacteriales bacterium]|nr:hypothetical protein [Flavobacteriales bacterium]